jgi:hypothetical protein
MRVFKLSLEVDMGLSSNEQLVSVPTIFSRGRQNLFKSGKLVTIIDLS